MRSLHKLSDVQALDEAATSHDADPVGSTVVSARRSAIDILKSHRADQLLTPAQQRMLSVIVEDINVIDPPRLTSAVVMCASARGEAFVRLHANSLQLLEDLCETPLVFAIRSGNTDAVRQLLSEGHDPNETDSENVSPLCHACEIQALEIVTLLVNANADINHETKIGHRPLDIARWHGENRSRQNSSAARDIVSLLLEHGATAHEPD